MALMSWNDNLSVGVHEIDTQHQKLVNMLNQLHEAMSKGQGAEVLKPILNGLIQYTASHFQTEERYMQRFNYPGYAKHKEEHDALTWKVKDLKDRFDQGKTMISVETMTFLTTWLTTHIQGTDKLYRAHFNSNGLM